MPKTNRSDPGTQAVKPKGGAQSIHRTIRILKAVSKFNEHGARLSQISRHLALPPPTVHRIVSVLAEEGFVSFDPVSKLYHMGPELYAMGEDTRRFSIRTRYRTAVDRITEQTGDSTYLVLRSGLDGVCIDRNIGSSRVQVLGYEIGERRPMGIGAASQALLAFLPEPEREQILEANAPRYMKYYDIHVDQVRTWLNKGLEMNITYSRNKITPDATGVGAPIYDKAGRVVASISTAGICARMTRERCEKNAQIIMAEIEAIDPPESQGQVF